MTAVQATNIRGVEPEWNSCLQTAAQSRRRISPSVPKHCLPRLKCSEIMPRNLSRKNSNRVGLPGPGLHSHA